MLTAFYTPSGVVDGMWATLRAALGGDHAPDDGPWHILEPGCGTGNFLAVPPEGMATDLTGVEIDPTTATIARLLNPGARIVNADIADCDIPAGSFDAVIGNVPYSNAIRRELTLADGKERTLPIHDYVIERAVDALRPGGVAILLTSRHTLDKATATIRRDLARKAELTGVARLSGSTFAAQAGTGVVSDIIVLRKRAATLDEAPDEAWTRTIALPVPGHPGLTVNVNQAIAANPAATIGTMEATTGPHGGDIRVTGPVPDAAGIRNTLDAAATPAGIGPRSGMPTCDTIHRAPAIYTYAIDRNGGVWYGDANHVELAAWGDGRKARRLRGMVRLRDQVRAIQALESDPGTTGDELDAARARLNQTYDGFTAEFGHLCAKDNRNAYNRAESSWHLITALEETDGKGRYAGKAAIFTRRTIEPVPPLPDHVDDPAEAIDISIDRTGRIDPGLVAGLLGIQPGQVADMLGELAVTDPDTGRIVPAEDYLSGDIADKLRHVRDLADQAANGPARRARDAWRNSLSHPGDGNEKAIHWIQRIGPAAWHSLLDPDRATAYTDPDAAIAAQDSSLDRLIAGSLAVDIARKAIADMPAGTRISRHVDRGDEADLGHTPPAWHARRGTNVLFDALLWEHPGRNDHTPALANDGIWGTDIVQAAALLDEATSSDRVHPGDKAALIATQFESIDHARRTGDGWAHTWQDTPIGAALRALMPGEANPADIADRAAKDPALMEYVRHQAEEALRGHPLLVPDRSITIPVDQAGLDAWRARRQEAIDAHLAADPAAKDGTERARRLGLLADRLAATMPKPLEPGEIGTTIGAPWIPPRVIQDFMADTFGLSASRLGAAKASEYTVEWDGRTGEWAIGTGKRKAADDIAPDAAGTYGTAKRTPIKLLETILNNNSIEVTGTITDADGRTRNGHDEEATIAAIDAAGRIRAAWTRWVGRQPGLSQHLADLYNERFNTIAPRHIDGSHLTFPGMASGIRLRAHQKDAVARFLRSSGQGTLLAHTVGAGKTFEAIAAIKEARRLGRATKPLVVVPNSIVDQWAGDFMRLYPGSRILVMDKQDRADTDAVRTFWGRASTGDWDAVIVPQSRFEMLHLSSDLRVEALENRVREFQDAAEARAGGPLGEKKTQDAKARIEGKITRLRARKENKDEAALSGIAFEELGFDMLVIDEAHRYKNLGVPAATRDLGMQTSSSLRAEDVLEKCDWLRSTGHGSNIIFLTGTPVSNTMVEMYSLQRYLAPDTLRNQGIETFPAWGSTYGQITEVLELKVSQDGFQRRKRFARYQNLPELMAGVHQFADIVTNKDLDLDLPELETTVVAVPITDSQRDEMRRLVARAERLRDSDPNRRPDPTEDNMLKVTTDGRKIALDPKLLKDDVERQPLKDGKVAACARQAARIWRDTADDKATQLIFCDTSVPGNGEWNVYAELKDRLVEDGVDRDDIAFIHDARTDKQRETLFARVRAGDIRILIGSTEKLGTGVNVQDRLIAIHDLDCPWRPADLEQRLGRIHRQNNMWDKVTDYRYVTEGTLDAYCYQTVERKARFVSQVMTSGTPDRQMEDLDDTVIEYAQLKAAATGDPDIQRRMTLQARLDQLTLSRQAHARAIADARQEIEDILEPLLATQQDIARHGEAAQPAAARARAIHQRHQGGIWEGIVIDGQDVHDRRSANRELVGAARRANPDTKIGEYDGLDIIVTLAPDGTRRLSIRIDGHDHHVGRPLPAPDAAGAASAISQLDRLIKNLADGPLGIADRIDATKERIAAARRAIDTPWDREDEYQSTRTELEKLIAIQEAREKAAETDAPSPHGTADDPATRTETPSHVDEKTHAPEPAPDGPTAPATPGHAGQDTAGPATGPADPAGEKTPTRLDRMPDANEIMRIGLGHMPSLDALAGMDQSHRSQRIPRIVSSLDLDRLQAAWPLQPDGTTPTERLIRMETERIIAWHAQGKPMPTPAELQDMANRIARHLDERTLAIIRQPANWREDLIDSRAAAIANAAIDLHEREGGDFIDPYAMPGLATAVIDHVRATATPAQARDAGDTPAVETPEPRDAEPNGTTTAPTSGQPDRKTAEDTPATPGEGRPARLGHEPTLDEIMAIGHGDEELLAQLKAGHPTEGTINEFSRFDRLYASLDRDALHGVWPADPDGTPEPREINRAIRNILRRNLLGQDATPNPDQPSPTAGAVAPTLVEGHADPTQAGARTAPKGPDMPDIGWIMRTGGGDWRKLHQLIDSRPADRAAVRDSSTFKDLVKSLDRKALHDAWPGTPGMGRPEAGHIDTRLLIALTDHVLTAVRTPPATRLDHLPDATEILDIGHGDPSDMDDLTARAKDGTAPADLENQAGRILFRLDTVALEAAWPLGDDGKPRTADLVAHEAERILTWQAQGKPMPDPDEVARIAGQAATHLDPAAFRRHQAGDFTLDGLMAEGGYAAILATADPADLPGTTPDPDMPGLATALIDAATRRTASADVPADQAAATMAPPDTPTREPEEPRATTPEDGPEAAAPTDTATSGQPDRRTEPSASTNTGPEPDDAPAQSTDDPSDTATPATDTEDGEPHARLGHLPDAAGIIRLGGIKKEDFDALVADHDEDWDRLLIQVGKLVPPIDQMTAIRAAWPAGITGRIPNDMEIRREMVGILAWQADGHPMPDPGQVATLAETTVDRLPIHLLRRTRDIIFDPTGIMEMPTFEDAVYTACRDGDQALPDRPLADMPGLARTIIDMARDHPMDADMVMRIGGIADDVALRGLIARHQPGTDLDDIERDKLNHILAGLDWKRLRTMWAPDAPHPPEPRQLRANVRRTITATFRGDMPYRTPAAAWLPGQATPPHAPAAPAEERIPRLDREPTLRQAIEAGGGSMTDIGQLRLIPDTDESGSALKAILDHLDWDTITAIWPLGPDGTAPGTDLIRQRVARGVDKLSSLRRGANTALNPRWIGPDTPTHAPDATAQGTPAPAAGSVQDDRTARQAPPAGSTPTPAEPSTPATVEAPDVPRDLGAPRADGQAADGTQEEPRTTGPTSGQPDRKTGTDAPDTPDPAGEKTPTRLDHLPSPDETLRIGGGGDGLIGNLSILALNAPERASDEVSAYLDMAALEAVWPTAPDGTPRTARQVLMEASDIIMTKVRGEAMPGPRQVARAATIAARHFEMPTGPALGANPDPGRIMRTPDMAQAIRAARAEMDADEARGIGLHTPGLANAVLDHVLGHIPTKEQATEPGIRKIGSPSAGRRAKAGAPARRMPPAGRLGHLPDARWIIEAGGGDMAAFQELAADVSQGKVGRKELEERIRKMTRSLHRRPLLAAWPTWPDGRPMGDRRVVSEIRHILAWQATGHPMPDPATVAATAARAVDQLTGPTLVLLRGGRTALELADNNTDPKNLAKEITAEWKREHGRIAAPGRATDMPGLTTAVIAQARAHPMDADMVMRIGNPRQIGHMRRLVDRHPAGSRPTDAESRELMKILDSLDMDRLRATWDPTGATDPLKDPQAGYRTVGNILAGAILGKIPYRTPASAPTPTPQAATAGKEAPDTARRPRPDATSADHDAAPVSTPLQAHQATPAPAPAMTGQGRTAVATNRPEPKAPAAEHDAPHEDHAATTRNPQAKAPAPREEPSPDSRKDTRRAPAQTPTQDPWAAAHPWPDGRNSFDARFTKAPACLDARQILEIGGFDRHDLDWTMDGPPDGDRFRFIAANFAYYKVAKAWPVDRFARPVLNDGSHIHREAIKQEAIRILHAWAYTDPVTGFLPTARYEPHHIPTVEEYLPARAEAATHGVDVGDAVPDGHYRDAPGTPPPAPDSPMRKMMLEAEAPAANRNAKDTGRETPAVTPAPTAAGTQGPQAGPDLDWGEDRDEGSRKAAEDMWWDHVEREHARDAGFTDPVADPSDGAGRENAVRDGDAPASPVIPLVWDDGQDTHDTWKPGLWSPGLDGTAQATTPADPTPDPAQDPAPGQPMTPPDATPDTPAGIDD